MSAYTCIYGDYRFEVVAFIRMSDGPELSLAIFNRDVPVGTWDLKGEHVPDFGLQFVEKQRDDSTDVLDNDNLRVTVLMWCDTHWLGEPEKVILKVGRVFDPVTVGQPKGKWKL